MTAEDASTAGKLVGAVCSFRRKLFRRG